MCTCWLGGLRGITVTGAQIPFCRAVDVVFGLGLRLPGAKVRPRSDSASRMKVSDPSGRPISSERRKAMKAGITVSYGSYRSYGDSALYWTQPNRMHCHRNPYRPVNPTFPKACEAKLSARFTTRPRPVSRPRFPACSLPVPT